MELEQIEARLDSPHPQERLKAIADLKDYAPEEVVPLLKRRMYDQEFLIRSFVAMGLGFQRTEEGFRLLVQLLEHDHDPNVRAQAANALAKYGERSLPHLLNVFDQDSHWLVRQSILAAMEGIECPDLLIQFCHLGIEGENLEVQLAAIVWLGQLQGTTQHEEALDLLLFLATARGWEIRVQVARVLRRFTEPEATAALLELRHDSDYRVVGATLEGLLTELR
uniref:PBS lyase HEAT domain protein repeat-containing protein n=1 Tax=Cyanothece sp. (strain PCC 7425 / ATCC 29141) TaxID=395961 RepID=B8HM09_CYAP4